MSSVLSTNTVSSSPKWYDFFTCWDMKKKISQLEQENIKFETNRHRPEIRDNLDSRINQEQTFKGGDVTHNKKEHRKPERKKGK